MAPYHYPMADFTIPHGETNILQRGRPLAPLLNTTSMTHYRNGQEILDKMVDNVSPSIAIHNYGQLVFCNGDRCHHGRKANLSKEIGQALVRSFSFVKNLRKGSSRRHRKTTMESSEGSMHDQDHQQVSQNSHLTMNPHELDNQYDRFPAKMPDCDAKAYPAEMEASFTGPNLVMPMNYHQSQEPQSTQSRSTVVDHPWSPDQFTSAPYPTPRSSVMSPVSISWLGSESDQPSWQMSQYSAVSQMTPQTSMSESDQFNQSMDISFDTSPEHMGPPLSLSIPPAPQVVFSNKDISMSPVDGDFDVRAMYEQMQNNTEHPDIAEGFKSTYQATENTWQTQDVFPLETPVFEIGMELAVAKEPFEEPATFTVYPTKLDDPQQCLSISYQPGNFSAMLKDAFGRFVNDMSARCPSEIVTCLTEAFSQTALSLQEHVNVSGPGQPFTLKNICSPAPSIRAALLALHALLAAGGSQDDLDTMGPKSQQLISLAILGYSLLCLSIRQGGDLSRAISTLHAQACSWSAVIHDASEAATYREFVDRYWLLGSQGSLNTESALPDCTEPEGYTYRTLCSPEEGSNTLIVDIAYMFIRLVASTVSQQQCETAPKDDHIKFDLPPSFDDVMKERFELSYATSGPPLGSTSFAVIERDFKIRGVQSFEELESCLEQQFHAKGWTSNDLIPIHFKSKLKKAEGFYKGRLVMWLWRVLEKGIKGTSRRTVGGQHMPESLKHCALPPALVINTFRPQEKHESPLEDEQHDREELMKLCNAGQWHIKTASPAKKPKKLHNKMHPSKYTDHQCDQCSKVFTGRWARGNLSRHKNHTKKHGKQYGTCEICHRKIGFVRSDHMRNHMKKVHLLVRDPVHKGKWMPIPPAEAHQDVSFDDDKDVSMED